MTIPNLLARRPVEDEEDTSVFHQRRRLRKPGIIVGRSGEGSSAVYGTISGAGGAGMSRVANTVAGYNVYVGVDALPDFASAPTHFTATLPYSFGVTPPVSGNRTINVATKAVNEYGLESTNTDYQTFLIDSAGAIVKNDIAMPTGVLVTAGVGGSVRVRANYPGFTTDEYRADRLWVWVGLTPPDPLVDLPTQVANVTGPVMIPTTFGSLSPGTYDVAVVLYRTLDARQSPAYTTTLVVPPYPPDEPTAVHGGNDLP